MKEQLNFRNFLVVILLAGSAVFGQTIKFPDIPGYKTLKCDFHQHTVFSDGAVWPSIRVQEALKDGLDAISITDHLEYQPYEVDIPHPDRNRSYQLANRYAKGQNLVVINGAEITRGMPPGHLNAIFLEDANKLLQDDVMEVFKEACRQGAFVFWNHPNWISQNQSGVATLTDMHRNLIKDGLINGIEIVNEHTYSDEAFQIAIDHNLAILGTSDIHGLIDWEYKRSEGDHRPLTLIFAKTNSEEAIKEALENRRTAVWSGNALYGSSDFLVPLIQESLSIKEAKYRGKSFVQSVYIENISDMDYVLENLSAYSLHTSGKVVTVKAYQVTHIQVKTLKQLSAYDLHFKVLNAFVTPVKHPEIVIRIE